MSTAIDYDAARRVLSEERSKLVHQLHELGATETGDLRSDLEREGAFADAAAATAERTELLGLVETLKHQVADIDAALSMLEAGTYGFCDSCGQPIDPARLEARPASRYCVNCQARRG